MMALQFVAEPAGNAATDALVSELARALHTESRLLRDLVETLRRQRHGVARDDVSAVDDSVFGAHRLLRTLSEARRRRRGLLVSITGHDEVPLRDWPAEFGEWLTPELRDACSRAQDAGELLAREIDINRNVLRSALATTTGLVRSLAGHEPAAGPATYGAHSGTQSVGPASVLIDREV